MKLSSFVALVFVFSTYFDQSSSIPRINNTQVVAKNNRPGWIDSVVDDILGLFQHTIHPSGLDNATTPKPIDKVAVPNAFSASRSETIINRSVSSANKNELSNNDLSRIMANIFGSILTPTTVSQESTASHSMNGIVIITEDLGGQKGPTLTEKNFKRNIQKGQVFHGGNNGVVVVQKRQAEFPSVTPDTAFSSNITKPTNELSNNLLDRILTNIFGNILGTKVAPTASESQSLLTTTSKSVQATDLKSTFKQTTSFAKDYSRLPTKSDILGVTQDLMNNDSLNIFTSSEAPRGASGLNDGTTIGTSDGATLSAGDLRNIAVNILRRPDEALPLFDGSAQGSEALGVADLIPTTPMTLRPSTKSVQVSSMQSTTAPTTKEINVPLTIPSSLLQLIAQGLIKAPPPKGRANKLDSLGDRVESPTTTNGLATTYQNPTYDIPNLPFIARRYLPETPYRENVTLTTPAPVSEQKSPPTTANKTNRPTDVWATSTSSELETSKPDARLLSYPGIKSSATVIKAISTATTTSPVTRRATNVRTAAARTSTARITAPSGAPPRTEISARSTTEQLTTSPRVRTTRTTASETRTTPTANTQQMKERDQLTTSARAPTSAPAFRPSTSQATATTAQLTTRAEVTTTAMSTTSLATKSSAAKATASVKASPPTKVTPPETTQAGAIITEVRRKEQAGATKQRTTTTSTRTTATRPRSTLSPGRTDSQNSHTINPLVAVSVRDKVEHHLDSPTLVGTLQPINTTKRAPVSNTARTELGSIARKAPPLSAISAINGFRQSERVVGPTAESATQTTSTTKISPTFPTVLTSGREPVRRVATTPKRSRPLVPLPKVTPSQTRLKATGTEPTNLATAVTQRRSVDTGDAASSLEKTGVSSGSAFRNPYMFTVAMGLLVILAHA